MSADEEQRDLTVTGQLRMQGDARIYFGDDTDVYMHCNQDGRITVDADDQLRVLSHLRVAADQYIWNQGGIKVLPNAGPVDEDDFSNNINGMIGAVDTTNGRLYLLQWRYLLHPKKLGFTFTRIQLVSSM